MEVEGLHCGPAEDEAQYRSTSVGIGNDEDIYHSDGACFFGPSRGALEEVACSIFVVLPPRMF